MLTKEDLLAKNVVEFYSEGNNALKRSSWNTAVSLFFKALAVLADWIILKKDGFIPKSHTERFRILQENYLDLYEVLDKDFPAYQDSYSINLSKADAEEIKNDFRKVAEKSGFRLD